MRDQLPYAGGGKGAAFPRSHSPYVMQLPYAGGGKGHSPLNPNSMYMKGERSGNGERQLTIGFDITKAFAGALIMRLSSLQVWRLAHPAGSARGSARSCA